MKESRELTDREVMYFLSGIASEDALLSYTGISHGVEKNWEGIYYTPDFYMPIPLHLSTCKSYIILSELKTRRGFKPADENIEDIYSGYIKQLRGYCAIEWNYTGLIHAWILSERQADGANAPELDSILVKFTDEELEQERGYLRTTRDLLKLALRTNDPSMLPNCEGWLCGKDASKMVKAPYCVNCKKEFASQKNIERHVGSKSGQGHEVKDAVYEKNYIKRCKWFDECKPFGEGMW
jgi:hypothetical protein